MGVGLGKKQLQSANDDVGKLHFSDHSFITYRLSKILQESIFEKNLIKL